MSTPQTYLTKPLSLSLSLVVYVCESRPALYGVYKARLSSPSYFSSSRKKNKNHVTYRTLIDPDHFESKTYRTRDTDARFRDGMAYLKHKGKTHVIKIIANFLSTRSCENY